MKCPNCDFPYAWKTHGEAIRKEVIGNETFPIYSIKDLVVFCSNCKQFSAVPKEE